MSPEDRQEFERLLAIVNAEKKAKYKPDPPDYKKNILNQRLVKYKKLLNK